MFAFRVICSFFIWGISFCNQGHFHVRIIEYVNFQFGALLIVGRGISGLRFAFAVCVCDLWSGHYTFGQGHDHKSQTQTANLGSCPLL